MNRILTISCFLLLITGFLPKETFLNETRSFGDTASYHGEMARTLHPLSYLAIPKTITLSRLTPIYETDIIGHLPKQGIQRNPDILFTLSRLHSQYPDLDLNEPTSQRFLLAYIQNEPYPSMITLSHERYFHIQLDNDIFNYTDRFYTNGIRLSLISPCLSQNPLTKLLIPYWNRGVNYYGLSLVQDMFTPSTTKVGGILVGDRPYAAYLYIGSFKITNDNLNQFRLTSEIQIGIVGPASLGEYVQRTFHNAVPTNNEPLGWEFQVGNDLLLNYYARFEKGIVSFPGLDLLVHGSGSLGTVYTNIGGGAYIRSGWFNSYFSNLYLSKRSLNKSRHARNIQFYFFADFSGKIIGYDATLQGGMFNNTSPYKIPGEDIEHMMFTGSGGIVFSYGGIQLKGEQFLISPEFKNGWWHKWLSVGLTFSF